MNPTLEQLARYVVQELERGVPESTLSASMRESGWTQEWINAALSAAKQRAVPATQPSLNMPDLHPQQNAQPLHHHSTRPAPIQQPAQPQPVRPTLRAIGPAPKQKQPRSTEGLRKILLIVIAVLAAVVVGLGIYRTINGIQHAAQQKVVRDADRREDLSVMLSNLSDYFVTHKSYPTRTQMNTASFLETNGFSVDSITDPKWSPKDEACAKDGKPTLAGDSTADCYAYEVTTAKGGVCNNATSPCTKVKVSIWLEVDKKSYDVIFDQNSQVNE